MNPLLSLLQLSDPTLPIGGYAHSAGLETYVQIGQVHDRRSSNEFITAMLKRSIHYTDAAFVSLSYDSAAVGNVQQLMHYDQECNAVKLPREIRLASQKLGIRLMKVFQHACPGAMAAQYREMVDSKKMTGHYCIAFGLFAQSLGIPKQDALTGFYYNVAAGMVTNCVKLVPLGQIDGQEMLFALQPLISALVMDTMHPDPLMIGLSSTGFDIRCMQHEQLYSRLYMS
jgi:urease accessory protein